MKRSFLPLEQAERASALALPLKVFSGASASG
jgi:hypothetical protein